MLQAFALVMPEEMAEAARRETAGAPEEPCPFWISDGILLVLAATSGERARRLAAYRPDLRARIEEVRADPQAYIESARMPPPDAEQEG